ncbi:hypothetical protein EDF18_2801 [Frigoribacterium sp. PhB107]|uniref:hypothetical protein n=1 Tax=Frigoribacterium sp. PhB107 TaxID=2485172 RepID=UPI000F9EB182|nr:hypothetical protein [Frigoribacterium sp. PhB107]ROP73438.1 hypothetical protein EDF18_2801 [Frigoribacterium sp. PhB107]
MPIPKKSCPHCGAATSMHASIAPGAGGRRVRWACLACGHAYDTTRDYWATRAVFGARD